MSLPDRALPPQPTMNASVTRIGISILPRIQGPKFRGFACVPNEGPVSEMTITSVSLSRARPLTVSYSRSRSQRLAVSPWTPVTFRRLDFAA